jgi:anti-sigma B factor antagonist
MDFVEETTQRSKHTPIFGYSVAGEDPVVVAIRGELDDSTAPDLSAVLEDLTLFNRSIALDLSAVEYMDSTGLHVLEKTRAALEEVGGHLRVFSASDRVRRVFELSGMDQVLPLPARSAGEAS